MLKQRVITAIVLLVVLLAAGLAPSIWPLIALFSLAAACALWEWLRLVWPVRSSRFPALFGSLSFVVFLFLAPSLVEMPADGAYPGLAYAIEYGLVLPVAVLWVLVIPWLVIRGQSQSDPGSAWLSAFGLFAVVAVWYCLTRLYLLHGAWFVVSLMALIWCADIAAYFSGKAFGRHKLAPKVSPGKTWEGVFGGVLAAVLWVLVSAHIHGSFAQLVVSGLSLPVVILISAFLAALSIVGDLFESLLKRRAGMKDSSQLLPGHGGVYDRIDALLPVAPLALLITGILT
jgi:phosphatidate cytidylyltransferase